jgi:hypothetical protein
VGQDAVDAVELVDNGGLAAVLEERPPTPSTSGEVARETEVAAPSSGIFIRNSAGSLGVL